MTSGIAATGLGQGEGLLEYLCATWHQEHQLASKVREVGQNSCLGDQAKGRHSHCRVPNYGHS